ncbi:dihydrodipicolinate synthase family protein [Salinicoccus albus]|uniref:dihydrodipicolinate synthase family protein n=1 Tax=Salinicoccus albus TaxID=418756 RepID=UPI0003703AA2|nr:dihydrodipicolinate synthase family protein [Salinicoccus albus]
MLKSEMHVAVPTAFYEDESLDTSATISHVKQLYKDGVKSVLISGTTGEQHSMRLEEKIELISALDNEADLMQEIEVIFGVASVRQKEAEQLAKKVRGTEIAAVMIGFPPYIIPSQAEAVHYAKKLIQISNKPAIIYNNPGRTGFDLSVESILELSQLDSVIGVKDPGDREKMRTVKERIEKEFYFYAGGEIDLEAKVMYGYNRLSSIAGNCYPHEIEEWFTRLIREEPVKKDTASAVSQILYEVYNGSPIVNIKDHLNAQGTPMGICRRPIGTVRHT